MGRPELRRGRSDRHPSEEVVAPRFTRSSEPFVSRIKGPRVRSEDLRAPGQRAPGEQRIRLHGSALAELLQTECLPELRERDPAEVGRAECRYVKGEVGLGVGALACAVLELPAAVVPLADRVAHLEHEWSSCAEGAAR